MFGQSHSRGISSILSFKTQLPFDRLPEWQEVRSRPLDEQARRSGTRTCGASWSRRPGTGTTAATPSVPRPASRTTTTCSCSTGRCRPNPTVAELAAERGVDPVELMIDLALEPDFDQFFVQPITTFTRRGRLPVMGTPGR